MKSSKLIKRLTLSALFIALEIVLTRFLSIQTPYLRIGFYFLPVAISGIMLGPWTAGIIAVLADLIGFFMFFASGAFHPGFTLSAFLSGLIFGGVLYKKEVNTLNVTLASALVHLGVNLGLGTLWLSQILGKGYLALLLPRTMKEVILLVISVPVILVVWKAIKRAIREEEYRA